MAVILAFAVLGERLTGVDYMLDGEPISTLKNFAVNTLGVTDPSAIAGMLVFLGLVYLLVKVPLKAAKQ